MRVVVLFAGGNCTFLHEEYKSREDSRVTEMCKTTSERGKFGTGKYEAAAKKEIQIVLLLLSVFPISPRI